MIIRLAERACDLDAVLALLRAAHLPAAGVDAHFEHFFVAREDERVVGVVGFEAYRHCGLLRSLAVVADQRRRGIGARLVEAVLGFAEALGISDVYLLTDDAVDYFRRFGFEPTRRDTLPDELKASPELAEACCASAVAMHRALATELSPRIQRARE